MNSTPSSFTKHFEEGRSRTGSPCVHDGDWGFSPTSSAVAITGHCLPLAQKYILDVLKPFFRIERPSFRPSAHKLFPNPLPNPSRKRPETGFGDFPNFNASQKSNLGTKNPKNTWISSNWLPKSIFPEMRFWDFSMSWGKGIYRVLCKNLYRPNNLKIVLFR